MKLAYIILNDSGERLDISKANEFNPNEYDFTPVLKDRCIGFYYDPEYPDEAYCYTPDQDEEPETATTLGFKGYDEDGHLICEDEGGCGMWL